MEKFYCKREQDGLDKCVWQCKFCLNEAEGEEKNNKIEINKEDLETNSIYLQ